MARTKAMAEAQERYFAKNKDKFATFSLRVKSEEKEAVMKKAEAEGKSITQYLLERAGVR